MSTLYPKIPSLMGPLVQLVQTEIPREFGMLMTPVYFQLGDPKAKNTNEILGKVPLNTVEKEVKTFDAQSDFPRALRIKGNAGGMAGEVKIVGENVAGEVMEEIFTVDEDNIVEGARCFAKVTSITLPDETNAATQQSTTISVTNGATGSGDLTATITSALFAGGDTEVTIPVNDTDHDTETKVAEKIVETLNADGTFSEHFEASNTAAEITITAKVAMPNDATQDIAIPNAHGVEFGASAVGDAGNRDMIEVGINDKLQLPFKLPVNTVIASFKDGLKEGTDATVVTNNQHLERNTIELDSALDGDDIAILIYA